MKQLYFGLSIIFLSLLFGGCASGRKALEKGNYGKAFSQAINRLRSNEDSKKARATLSKAYKFATEAHMSSIQQAKQMKSPFMWETISSNYQQINNMYNEILHCPACREIVPNPKRYDAELAKANQNAAAARYDMGMLAMTQKQNRAKAIEAHQHFKKAQQYVPRYKDIEDKLNESLYFATLKVVVEPIPVPFKALNISHEFFVNKINEYLHNNRINEYVRFYTPEEITAEKVEFVDQIIRMEFDQFSIGNVTNTNTIKEVSKDSVLLQGKGEDAVYGTVKAKVTVHQKSITGGGVLDFKIVSNESNAVISQEKFPSQYTWGIQWASFNGDERALSDADKALVNKVELPIPNPQWMFEEFTAPIYDQVIGKMRNYYRNY